MKIKNWVPPRGAGLEVPEAGSLRLQHQALTSRQGAHHLQINSISLERMASVSSISLVHQSKRIVQMYVQIRMCAVTHFA